MRFDRPPVFMISPASMKNGTAEEEKLSAPLMIVLRDDLGIEDVHIEHQGDAAEQQGIGDRHPDRHGAKERADEDAMVMASSDPCGGDGELALAAVALGSSSR